jgi:serine/threonine-protein kinase
MIGTTLGRYRILELLGEGGMGRVYRALDQRLEREVAVKLLRVDLLREESARKRFRLEARALSRVNHPAVATLFDFESLEDTDFLVLEFVPGETLARRLEAGPLPERRARVIALAIAEALEAAHDLGVVHRDLKPGNVMLTPRGRVKVLDFGLARLTDVDLSLASTVSAAGPVLGTVPYMSPEQIAGTAVDARSDLHALGAVLYEMLSGERPFAADSLASLVYRIVHEPPRPLRELRPGVSEDLARIVERCLEKDPARRFGGAAALVRALAETDRDRHGTGLDAAADALVHPPAPAAATGPAIAGRGEPSARASAPPARAEGSGIRSLVVLPLENRSGDASQEFFVDGMTDALIADLARIGALRVISRTTAMRYKGTRMPLQEIAEQLHVDAVVEGSALQAGGRVRITVQLVDALGDRSLWSESYERDFVDILRLQSEVARAIASQIKIHVTPEEQSRLSSGRAVNPIAHIAYLKGRSRWNLWTTEGFTQSLEFYREALAADPSYALAWSGLADAYSSLANTNVLAPGEGYRLAREAALKGLALDDSRAELHAAFAAVTRFHDWDWPAAERSYLRALELNPGYAYNRVRYANFLSGLGRHSEAIQEAERALEYDPQSLVLHTGVGDVLFYAREYERSTLYYRRSLEMSATFGPGHTDLARSLEHLGRYDEALREFLLGQPDPQNPRPSTGLAIFNARVGRRAEADGIIAGLCEQVDRAYVSPFGIASYHAVTGQRERALDWLERAHEQRDGTLVWLKVHPRLDGLRAESRFRDLLTRMKLDS